MMPIHAKIEGVIRQRITDGTYTCRIPKTSELALEFGVPDHTVIRALQALKDDGLIFTRRSRGTFITGSPPQVPPGHGGVHTVAEVADIMGVSRHTIIQHINGGMLQARRRGPRIYEVPDTSLRQYLASYWRCPAGASPETIPDQLTAMLRQLGRKLQAARKDAGYSQASLAHAISSTQAKVSAAERGIPTSRELFVLADSKLKTAGALARAYDQIDQTDEPQPQPQPPEPDDLITSMFGAEIQFLTVDELSRVTRLSKMTIYRAVEAGDLEGHRFGRSIRIPRPSACEYLTAAGDTRPDG